MSRDRAAIMASVVAVAVAGAVEVGKVVVAEVAEAAHAAAIATDTTRPGSNACTVRPFCMYYDKADVDDEEAVNRV